MMAGLLGAMASAPIDSEIWSSVRGVQWTPLSRVSQTPPWAAAINQCALLPGSTARHVTRPQLGWGGFICVFIIGAGPILTHCGWTASAAVKATILMTAHEAGGDTVVV